MVSTAARTPAATLRSTRSRWTAPPNQRVFNFDANTVTNFEAGVKKGAGTWILEGTAGTGIDGTFDVQDGKLSVNGSMTSTDFVVEAGATLGGGGTIKSFTTSGTIAPGNSIDTLHVGTAAFDAGSIYEVEINPTTSDLVHATGPLPSTRPPR